MFARRVILWFGGLGPGTVCCGSILAAVLLACSDALAGDVDRWGYVAIALFSPLLAWFPIRWYIEARRTRSRQFFTRGSQPPQD